MKPARLIILAIAICAGAAAAYLASSSEKSGPVIVSAPQLPTVDVLVAKGDIALGQKLTPEDLQWQTWPQGTASKVFVRRGELPEAIKEFAGSIARSPFIAGEPIREQKLVKADGSGFMAAILPSGMRALSTEITPETGAGGFILPNDRVDVILSRRERAGGGPDAPATESVSSRTILTNVRVLAIDQAPKEKEGQNAVVGKTATLEVTPEDAEVLAKARQSGALSLALRSIADGRNSTTVRTAESNLVTIYRGPSGGQEVYTCVPLCEKQ